MLDEGRLLSFDRRRYFLTITLCYILITSFDVIAYNLY